MNELVYIILVSVMLGASVVIVGFMELNNFSVMNNKNELMFEIKQLDDKMITLSKYSYGSFDTFNLRVPMGSKVVLYKNGSVIIDKKIYRFSRKITCITSNSEKCVDKVEYDENHKIILYHGDNPNAKYAIAFE